MPTQRTSAGANLVTRRRLLITPLSPIGLALISYVVFIGATVFPPSVYESVMAEPDWMFMNPSSFVFVTLCVLGFVTGVFTITATSIGRSNTGSIPRLGRLPILIPLALAFTINLVSVLRIARNTPDLITGWLDNGAAAKHGLDITNALTQALPLLYAVCWWGLWQILRHEEINRRRNTGLRAALLFSFVAALGTAAVKVARYDLMPMIFGMAITYMVFKLRSKRVRLSRYFMFVCVTTFCVVTVFVLFSWLRGSDSQSELANTALGYSIASYDRLAGILDGRINYPYGGTGTYVIRFLSNIPLLNRWTDFGMPDGATVLRTEFVAVSASGLHGGYNWGSAFGYVYADVGWAAPLYFMLDGALSMWAWRRLKAGRAAGVLLYPWLAFSVLFWFGSNIVVYPQLVTFAGAAVLLSFYERLAHRRALLVPRHTGSLT